MTPEGDYEALIHAAYLGFDRFGHEAACVELDIQTRAGITTERWAGGFDGKWMERTVNCLRICGWTGDDLNTLHELVGRKVSISIVYTRRGDKVYPNVYINPRKRMDPNEAKDFAASMKRLIAETSQPDFDGEPDDVAAPRRGGIKATPAPPADPDDYEITPEDRAAAKAFEDAPDGD